MSIHMILGLLFFILLLLINGDKGVITFLSLVGNLCMMFFILMAILIGVHPYIATFIGMITMNFITLYYQSGNNIKTKMSLLSVSTLIVFLFFFVAWFHYRLHLEGLNEVQLQSDLPIYYSFVLRINLQQITTCLILIGLLGAIMDTAISISSSLYEISILDLHTQEELFSSGMAIGKDIIATTINTLTFVYMGESILLLLYLQKYRYSLIEVLNSKAFLQDAIPILFSMIGCTLIIPITSYFCSRFFQSRENTI